MTPGARFAHSRAMLPTGHDEVVIASRRVHRRLSARQRWDLGLLFAAGLVSTTLFVSPLLIPEQPQLTAQPETSPAVAPIQVVSALHEAVVTAPQLAAPYARRRTLSRPVSYQLPREQPAARRSSPPLAKKLGRLVAGDGRYSVRPFPAVEPEPR